MSRYIETIDEIPTIAKPILFTTYDDITKYILHIKYEDETVKDVEIVPNDKNRLYKFTYKKEGKLFTVTGIPSVYEIKENIPYTDITNTVLEANDLLFKVDHSDEYESKLATFYLKDIRDIVDIASETSTEDPGDDMGIIPIAQYVMYVNNHSSESVINCTTDDSLRVDLKSEITKMGDPLQEGEYSGFSIVEVTMPDKVPLIETDEIKYEVDGNNSFHIIIPEVLLGHEFRFTLKYYVKEINKSVFDEFKICITK